MPLHKGNQKRIYFEGATYFVTNHTKNWFNFFEEPIFCEVFIANLKLCMAMKELNFYAFVVLLHHFHLLFMPENPKDLSKVMQFLKRHISRHINYILGYETEGAICKSLLRLGEELDMHTKKRRILGIEGLNENIIKGSKYRIYEKLLEGHYKFLLESKKQFVLKYGKTQNIFPKFRWEKSYRDHYIRNDKDFDEHVKYIYNNPFKHKISDAENYKYIFTNYPELINEF